MRNTFSRTALAAAAALSLSACAGGVPSGAPSGPAAENTAPQNVKPAPPKLSGEYTGTVTDNMHGKGPATASLAQSGSSVGGTLSIAGSSPTADVAWTQNGSAVDGTSVFVAASAYCTFSHSGTYNAKTRKLIGTYQAVYGCTGETGRYVLKHQCYYKGTKTNDIRPESGPHPC